MEPLRLEPPPGPTTDPDILRHQELDRLMKTVMAIDGGRVLRWLCTSQFFELCGLPPCTPELRQQLDKDFADIKRAADYLLLVGLLLQEMAMHFEFQKRPDAHMGQRQHRYQGAVVQKHGVPVLSVVLLLSGAQRVPFLQEKLVLGPLSQVGWLTVSIPHLVALWPERTDSPMAEMLRALLWLEPSLPRLRELIGRLREMEISEEDCRSLLLMLSFLLEIRLGGDGSRHVETVNEVLAMLQLEDSWIYQAAVINTEAKAAAKGEAKGKADALIGLLTARLGRLEPGLRDVIHSTAQAAPERISGWLQEAFTALDAEAATRIAQRIAAS